jgi:hypothetical protein
MSRSGNADVLGKRYRCDDIGSADVCLDILSDSCSLVIARGRGIPAEPGSRLVLVEGETARIAKGPNHLVGCVEISTPAEALDYLRFFSSYETVHLFEDQRLEVFETDEECFAVCLPTERWQQLGLSEARVEVTEGGFEVTRLLIKPTSCQSRVEVFRVVESVGWDGRVKEISSDPVPVSDEDRLRLSFPHFL